MNDPQDDFDSAFGDISATRDKAPELAAEPPQNTDAAPAPTAPAPVEGSAEPAPTAQPDDPAELRRQLEQALHRERSSASRISAFAKEANRLNALVTELQRVKAETPAAPVAAAPPPADDVLSQAPDLAQAVDRRISEAMATANKAVSEANARADAAARAAAEARAAVDPFVEQQRKERQAQTWKGLDERFQGYDWRKDINTPEFDQWVKGSEPWVQELYDAGESVDQSATVLTLFYGATGKKPSPPPTVPSAADNANTARLRLAAGVPPRGNARQPTAPAESDFDANFAAAATQMRKQA